MRDIIEQGIKSVKSDYVEIRLENREGTRIAMRGPNIEQVNTQMDFGGAVRALVDGGWGFSSFNSIDGLIEACHQADSAARLVGMGLLEEDKVNLASIPVHTDTVRLDMVVDPRTVPLQDKVALFKEYNDILYKTKPEVQSSSLIYADIFTTRWFANSEGSFIQQEMCDMGLSMTAIGRQGSYVQPVTRTMGSVTDFSSLRGLHHEAADAVETCVQALAADPVRGGTYTVVLDPRLAGVFVHEAFGHLSESDFVHDNPQLREVMSIGRRFGPDFLNIYDSPSPAGLRGSCKYDDEGTPAVVAPLIEAGLLAGRLHSRETAHRMGEGPTGNARALSYRYPPVVRMRNTMIAPGTVPFDDLLDGIEEGVYAVKAYGGQTAMEQFTFSAAEGFMIRKGRIAERVKDVVLTGNVFDTLMNIEAIGSDFSWGGWGIGGCGKSTQHPLPVMMGAPSIRIRNVVVGGR